MVTDPLEDATADQGTDRQRFAYDYLRRLTQAWTPAGPCSDPASPTQLGAPASVPDERIAAVPDVPERPR